MAGPALSDTKDQIGACTQPPLPVETPSKQEGNLKEVQVEYYGIEMAQHSLVTKHLGGLGRRSSREDGMGGGRNLVITWS